MTDGESAAASKAAASSAAESPKLAEAGISEETIEQGFSLEGLDPHDHEALKGLDHWQDIQLKRSYAMSLLRLMAGQLSSRTSSSSSTRGREGTGISILA